MMSFDKALGPQGSTQVISWHSQMTKESIFPELELRQLSKNLESLAPASTIEHGDKEFIELDCLLRKLLLTAEQVRLSAPHRAAACNALCGFLERGAASCSHVFQRLCLGTGVWNRVFHMYLERFDDAPAKPMKQVVATLMKLVVLFKRKECDAKDTPQARYAVALCVQYVTEEKDYSCVKPAMLFLDTVLGRGIISASHIMSLYGASASRTEAGVSSSKIEAFTSKVLRWSTDADIAPMAGRLLRSFYTSLATAPPTSPLAVSGQSDFPLWVPSVQLALREHDGMIEILERHILPDLLRINTFQTTSFLDSLPLGELSKGNVGAVSGEDIRLCLLISKTVLSFPATSTLCMSRMLDFEAALIREAAALNIANANVSGFSATQMIASAVLMHSSVDIRVTALSLLTCSWPTIESAAHSMVGMLQHAIPFFHAETDTKSRNDFLSFVKSFFARLCIAINRHDKPVGRNAHSPREENPLSHSIPVSPDPAPIQKVQINFIVWYLNFLVAELRPTASYQRHITALKVIQLMISSDLWRIAGNRMEQEPLLRMLLDLILDAFDDVRGMAASLLKRLPATPQTMELALQHAEKAMCQTGRADHADGSGRLIDVILANKSRSDQRETKDSLEHLLQALEHDIGIASENLRLAVAVAPVHGRLIALRYAVSRHDFYKGFAHDEKTAYQDWRAFHNRLFKSCVQVWRIVRGVLCLDSPGGHIGIDLEDDELDIGTKDALSFSWRALKEASLLIQTTITNQTYGPSSSWGGLLCSDLKEIGDISFAQLAELRHRGAFSTVSNTFTSICIRCADSNDPSICVLPQKWYQEALLCIQEKASALTRRSAGLPAMLTGVLSAFPQGSLLDAAVIELQTIASAAVEHVEITSNQRLPQVHALNCLKEIFTNTRLAAATEQHLSTTLTIAVNCLEQELWAIRNCGLMLLKALLVRLSGGRAALPHGYEVPTYQRFSKTAYVKYPQLADLVIGLLERSSQVLVESQGSSDNGARLMQIAYPAMEIIERIGIPEFLEKKVFSCLLAMLDSSIWSLRDKAAKTLSMFVDETAILGEVRDSIQSQRNNALHGILLCLRHFMRRKHEQSTSFSIYNFLVTTMEQFLSFRQSPLIIALYLDMLSDTSTHVYEKTTGDLRASLTRDVEDKVKQFMADLKTKPQHAAEANLTILLSESVARFRVRLKSHRVPLGGSESQLCKLLKELKDVSLQSFSAGIGSLDDDNLFTTANGLIGYLEIVHEVCEIAGTDCIVFALEHLTKSLTVYLRRPQISIDDLHVLICQALLELLEQKVFVEPQRPDLANTVLRSHGAILSMLYIGRTGIDVTEPLCRWRQQLRSAIDDDSDFDVRFAAITSIGGFREALRFQKCDTEIEEVLLDIRLTLYDALNDDDEDIRNKAAEIGSWVLSNSNASLCLMAQSVQSKLLEALADRYHDSPGLCREALSRVLGVALEESQLELVPFGQCLEKAMQDDNSLFVKEKQNLFVDEVQEAERWVEIVKKIPYQSLIQPYGQQIDVWVREGLKSLVDGMRSRVDGPLGWCSKPEVFTLGIRILLGADLALTWSRNGHLTSLPEILDALQGILDCSTGCNVHGAWLQKARVLMMAS